MLTAGGRRGKEERTGFEVIVGSAPSRRKALYILNEEFAARARLPQQVGTAFKL